MYRVGITLKNGERMGKNKPSKDECDTYILELMETMDIKRVVIQNKDDKQERYTENF